MTAIFVIAQSLAAILLGAVGLLPGCHGSGGELNRRGFLLLGLGAVVFVTSTASIQALNSAESIRYQRRIEENQRRTEELIDRYFNVVSGLVMTTQKAPSSPPATTGQVIMITSPPEGGEVDRRHAIEGTVSSPAREVWVVVHPLDTSSYWVQPRVSVDSSGAWQSMAYFGRSGDLDIGKRFEIVAIADPHSTLHEGEYGNAWPKAKWTSKPITVIRH